MSPIRGENIFDIFRYWVNANSGSDLSKRPDLRMLIKFLPCLNLSMKISKQRQFYHGGEGGISVHRKSHKELYGNHIKTFFSLSLHHSYLKVVT